MTADKTAVRHMPNLPCSSDERCKKVKWCEPRRRRKRKGTESGILFAWWWDLAQLVRKKGKGNTTPVGIEQAKSKSALWNLEMIFYFIFLHFPKLFFTTTAKKENRIVCACTNLNSVHRNFFFSFFSVICITAANFRCNLFVKVSSLHFFRHPLWQKSIVLCSALTADQWSVSWRVSFS